MKIVQDADEWMLVNSEGFEVARRSDRAELQAHWDRLSAVPRDDEERMTLQTLAVGAVRRATRSRDEPWAPGTGFITRGRSGIRRDSFGWRGMNRRKHQP